ncbi:hypothetical protein SDC9_45003 [bioreactor metagenome]|uniref:NAD-specific glutamate dehydrogenase n=1 Tax=bioreactor metagenome TaxID=1076179 RepID=A0A644W4W2_9ZZZZ
MERVSPAPLSGLRQPAAENENPRAITRAGAGSVRRQTRSLAAFGSVHRTEVLVAVGGVDRRREGRRRFRLGATRLDHLAVALGRDLAHAGGGATRARRDQTADDHVLLQADKLVALALHRSLGEHAGGLLEGGRRDEGPRLQRGLGDAQKHRLARSRTAAAGLDLGVLFLELLPVDVLALQQRGVARVADLDLLQHLANDHLDVLVVDLHALQTIDVLHLVDEVVGQSLDPHDAQNVVRRRVAVHDVVTLLHEVAFLHRDVLAFRHHVFDRLQTFLRRLDRDATLVLVVLAEAHIAIDLGDDRVVLRTTRLEEFGHTRQTAGDVLRLRAFARDTRDGVAGLHLITVLDRENGVDRHRVGHRVAGIVAHRLAVGVDDEDLRLQVVALRRRAPVGHDLLRHAGRFVGLFAHRDARDEVDEPHHTALFGDDRQGVGVPFEQLRPALDRIAFLDVQLRAVAELVGHALGAVIVDDGDLHVPAHHDLVAILGHQKVRVAELDLAFLRRFLERLLAALGDAADVEGTHGQLRAGFADRLGGDDADRFADVDERAARQIATVAERADALLGLAGQRRADPHGLHAVRLDQVGLAFVDQLVLAHDHVVGAGNQNVIRRDAAEDALGKRRHDFAVVDGSGRGNRMLGAAVMRAHDAVLRDVDETTGQVARVRGLQRGVGQTLTGAVGRVEVLEHGQAFLEVRDDRRLDDLARGLGHQAAHPAELLHLRRRTTRTGVRHHVDRVRFLLHARVIDANGGDFLHHLAGDFVRALRPGIDHLVVLFALSDQAVHVLLLEFLHLIADAVDDGPLGVRHHHVVLAEGHAGLERLAEAHRHDLVTEDHRFLLAAVTVDGVDDVLHVLLAQQAVHQIEGRLGVQRQERAKPQTAGRGLVALEDLVAFLVDLLHPRRDLRVQVHRAGEQAVLDFLDGAEDHAFARQALALHRGVVEAENHVLRRHDDRRAVRRRQNVVRRHHQHARFQLRLEAQRNVHGHLVTVEVGVEGRADERVQLDRLAFDQRRFERLEAQTVQRRRAVQEHRVLADDFIQDIPDLGTLFLDQLLRLLHGARQALGLEARIDEGLEQLERHFLRQAALVQLQLRPGHDDRTAGEVDALAEQVLTEPALLALEHVGQRLQRTLVGAGDDAAATAVVEQRIDRFLQHALFVAHDDVGRSQLDQPLQTVVTVDDATIEVVQVRGRKAATIERHQRAQFRRDHRQHGQDHPFGTVARLDERLDDLQPLDDLLRLQLARGFLQLLAELFGGRLEVDRGQHLADRLGADIGGEGVRTVLVLRVEILVLGQQLAIGQVGQAGLDDDVVFEVEDALEITQRHVQHQADARGQRLEEPDMGDGRGQLDVAHALAADLLQRHFDAAFLADDAAILHPLVLAAQAFVVLDRPEDAGAEQAVALGLEGPVVDGLGLLDLAIGPRQDPLGRGQRDLDLVKGLRRHERVERILGQFLVHLLFLE